MKYQEFLQRKTLIDVPTGLNEFGKINKMLFPFQTAQTEWGLKRGRAVIADDCGLGKTPMQLETARLIHEATGKPVLIVAPLAVAQQTIREGKKFGVEITYANRKENITTPITITNYDMLHAFDASYFICVILDEGSILKSYNGSTRNQILEMFAATPYKFVYTATPAPNDYMELGNYAEFLGVMSRTEMLATFFIHDGGDTAKWRLKGHAEDPFWRWLSSWMMVVRKPSDLGYSDEGFALPPLNIEKHLLSSDATPGFLFPMPAETLNEQRQVKRGSIEERCDAALKMVRKLDGKPAVIWCELNDEGDYLEYKLGKKCVQVSGKDDMYAKEEKLMAFTDQEIPYIISKPSVAGFGLNWQFCPNMFFVNISHSYEQFYQAVRRCWRFGQKKPVNVHVVMMEAEIGIWENIQRKQREADEMAASMVEHMKDTMTANIRGVQRERADYEPAARMRMPNWIKETA